MISHTVLVAVEPFSGELSAARAAGAIRRGLLAGDPELEVDLCPIEMGEHTEDVRTLLEGLDFDTRMRAARAVILGAGRLDEGTLLGSPTFEIATRARQSGVPAYAVAGESLMSPFDARILDLQVILEAGSTRALRGAGEKLARLV